MTKIDPPVLPKPAQEAHQGFDYNKRLDELTTRISEIVRSSSLGLIAVAWLGLSATTDSSELVRSLSDDWLLTGAALALLALFLDFSQYVSGYFALLGDKRTKGELPHRKSTARKIRFVCFYSKMVSAAISSVVIIVATSAAVLGLKLWF